ncbi:hypothetical protein KTH71_03725 [Acinetobacter sp. WU_MDCI_Axc73]|nr:hypothetical protein [Acinetobacter sp. WU_MDCI_Axc73]
MLRLFHTLIFKISHVKSLGSTSEVAEKLSNHTLQNNGIRELNDQYLFLKKGDRDERG